ncbi:dipeptidyl aminopeptidase [Obba rivulosa]|uniref:Dipeptidyl aminopeptidase n=1 Tax=Obba rivulosa TaxID=1052685 RepID=A0A8E2AX53_9APHY|nr:dipeptidyl aminopeptidase [Obba rivulosa]
MSVSSYEPLAHDEPLQESPQRSQDHAYEPSPVRPHTYYGEGPFDAPSSDEEDELLEKPSSPDAAERNGGALADEGPLRVGGKQRPASVRILVVGLIALVGTAAIIGFLAAQSYSGTAFRIRGTQRITMDHAFNGTFYAQRQGVLWVPEAGDGVFATSHEGYIELVDLKTNSTRNLVAFEDVKNERGFRLSWADWKLSSDMRYILIKSDYVKQWRHSSFGNYYIHDLETQTTFPLTTPSHPPVTAYATWSPTGQSIAYVMNNDLYVVPSPSPSASAIRVTTSGNASLFHGVLDWVYEEEVFSADFALWWAPDASKVAYLRFDETAVEEYTFPVYNPGENAHAVVPYPDHVTMKYPKPGYDNPLVTLHIFDLAEYLKEDGDEEDEDEDEDDGDEDGGSDRIAEASLTLDWDGRQPADNSIISEVAWVGNATLLIKEVTRAADNGSVVFFDLDSEDADLGRIVRKLGVEGEHGDKGWIESAQSIYPIAASATPYGSSAYLDIVPTPSGYNHIALFSPVNSSSPQFLTSGDWEVTGGILAVDTNRSLVYFQAANPSSIERRIYAVPLPESASAEMVDPIALTASAVPAYYEADFSPEAGYYVLSYLGPEIPWQRIIDVEDKGFDYVLTENPKLNDTLSQYDMPIVTHSTIDSDGYELNVVELRPPRMDDSGRTKYPVLFRVYGGPGSQMVNVKYGHDWQDFLVSSLQYIVVIVDGRGTGFKGRRLRNPVKDNLGHYETIDQINAAKIWAAKDYVDPQRIGIWGWSYGGFMSSKVVEAGAGIHSLAMAVAPVTSWRLYDSIYTERYMNLPDVNPAGYVTASISNVTAFKDVDFLLAHGSGDDNVHFANSAYLLDMFTHDHVRTFRFRMFTDSDHSIVRRGAYRELFEFMTEFLVEKWGKGGKRRS